MMGIFNFMIVFLLSKLIQIEKLLFLQSIKTYIVIIWGFP